jgi:hypothetical protein
VAAAKKPEHPKTIRENAEFLRELSLAMKSSAEALFDKYLAGEIESTDLETCLEERKLKGSAATAEFTRAIPAAFLERSAAALGKVRGQRTQEFARVLSDKISSGTLVLFRLAGHFAEAAAPTGEKAGFHRGEQSIFMNFSTIPANDWLLIFAHEYAHSLDRELSDAMPTFADPALHAKVAEMAARTNRPASLSVDERQTLDRWLIAGLNRGFLAEARAWALSFEIYEEGIRDGAWKPIDWMERVLKHRRANEPALRFALRYLSPRFQSPSERGTLLAQPLLTARLKTLRADILAGKIAVSPIL